MATRSVICTVLGHVDHGKSSILDKIRGSAIVKSEAGQITQAIGASIIPLETVQAMCGDMLKKLKINFTIPGLLFIDTPGHEAFTHLRKRGGNIADIAIVVVDLNEGFMPQTLEALEILRHAKTPFILAANKVDLLPGWKSNKGPCLASVAAQSPQVQQTLDTRLYTLVGTLSEHKFEAERFDRVSDYTKQVAIVPCSAKSGEGIAELLMVIAGLAQRFLEQSLQFNPDGPAKGTILEVKRDKGLGTTLDLILYDGTLNRGDTLVIGSLGEPVVTKVKALFEPAPLAEMRDKKSKFSPVHRVQAATGVKVSGIGIDDVVAGMPVLSILSEEDLDDAKAEVSAEVNEVLIETNEKGVIIKADSLGSLEAMVSILREKGVGIRRAGIGPITRKDLAEAESNIEKDPLLATVLAFNVETTPDAKTAMASSPARTFSSNVIYSIIDEFDKWVAEQTKLRQSSKMGAIVRPCKMQFLRGYVFRQSNPAIVGMEVLAGTARTGTHVMKDGKQVGTIKGIQHEKQNISEAQEGMRVALSVDGATVGRQLHEGDIVYAVIPEADFRQLKEVRSQLKESEIAVLREYAAMMRKDNPLWGV